MSIKWISQNIICSAAELSHSHTVSAPDGWIHRNYWSSPHRLETLHMNQHFKSVIFMRFFCYLSPGTELQGLIHTSHISYHPLFPFKILNSEPYFIWYLHSSGHLRCLLVYKNTFFFFTSSLGSCLDYLVWALSFAHISADNFIFPLTTSWPVMNHLISHQYSLCVHLMWVQIWLIKFYWHETLISSCVHKYL